MEKGKHTPGPWLVTAGTVYVLQQDGWRRGEPVLVNRFSAHVQPGHAGGEPTPECELEANARLIAAAPALLEALKDTLALVRVKYGNLDADVNTIVERSLTAIAQAEGDA